MSIIEMSGYNDDDVIEIINTGQPTHESTIVDNVVYSSMSRKEAKREKDRHEAFMKWSASLGGNKDVVIETHNFQVTQKTTEYDSKGRPIKQQQQQQEQQSDSTIDATEEMKKHHSLYYSNDPQVQRFIQAKKLANLL